MVMNNRFHTLDRDSIYRALASFYGVTTANGNVGGTTLFCSVLIGSNDFITNCIILLDSGVAIGEKQGAAAFNPLTGQITVNPAFSAQITAGTAFYVLTQQAVAAAIAVILAALGVPGIDAAVNLLMRDVVGNKADTAIAANDNVSSVMRYLKGILPQVMKLLGAAPVVGQVVGAPAQWQGGAGTSGEVGSDLVTLGGAGVRNKLHSLLVNISALTPGATITVKMFMLVNGAERKVYNQNFVQGVDPNGLWIVNGTVGLHEALRVEVQSNNALDNGLAIDYDYMLEAM